MRALHFSAEEILETIDMVRVEQLDIRTITIGISLLDCVADDVATTCDRIYDKVTTVAADLTRTSRAIGSEFGLPIVNNRVSVTPISLVAGGADADGLVRIARTLDRAAHELGIDFIGGFSAQEIGRASCRERVS
jgi:uncharacterized protein (UPF0210 family)